MSYEFTKLSDVPTVDEFPVGANALIETNGEIKRCPSAGGGGVELITLTQDGDTFTASKNSEEILTLMDGGKLPMLVVPTGAVTSLSSTGFYLFPCATDGTEFAETAGFVFGGHGLGFAIVDSAGVTTLMIGN